MRAVLGRAPPPRLDRLVGDIEAAILTGDRAHQSDLVRRSADALTRRWSRLPPPDKPGFDRLLAELLDQVDDRARAAFARHLAPLRRAPRLATTRLASDPAIAVAGPLLEGCLSFDDPWLLALLDRLEPAHQTAVARRPAVSAALCDALLDRGAPGVAAALLTNPGADIPPVRLAALIPQAEDDEALAVALAGRPDLTGQDRTSLVALTRRTACAGLVADHGCDPAEAEALLDLVATTFAATVPSGRAACYAGAAAIAARPGGFGPEPATPARLIHWMALRRTEDVVAVLARDAALPVGVLIACTEAAAPQALALVLRGLGHPWSLLKALIRRPQAGEPAPELLARVHRLHAETSGPTARRVARHAAARIGLGAFATTAEEESREVLAVTTMTTPPGTDRPSVGGSGHA